MTNHCVRICRLIAFVAILLQLPAQAQEDANDLIPEPGKFLRINFPDLPPTLLAMTTGNDIPTAVSVRLPNDYNADGTFPLYVFLEGGNGGAGSAIGVPMQISSGGNGVIVASFPLFKENYDTDQRWPFVVGVEDLQTVSSAYETILDRLREIIPNIDPNRSIIGGHSNGAKTLGVLLSGLDENILDSFGGFFFIDGGLNWSSINRPNTLGDHHIFFLVGGGRENPTRWRKHSINRIEYFRESAAELGMTRWRFETFDGVGHEFAQEYYEELRTWAKEVGPAIVPPTQPAEEQGGTWDPPEGLEFLRAVPELRGVHLKMLEPEFQELIKSRSLTVRHVRSENGRSYWVTTDSGENVIVMFEADKCTGIQRMRPSVPANGS